MATIARSLDAAAIRSLKVFPGGSNGEFGLPPDLTRVIARGQGARLWDTQGREMIDFSMGWGSVLPGHARPEVVHAVASTAASGTNFAYTNSASLSLASEIVRLSPACDAVRFCASGTEAIMYCLRLARAWSSKRSIIKFEGAYHGAGDEGVTSLFPRTLRDYPHPEPTSAGIQCDHTLIAPYNDLDTTRTLIERYKDTLAAVIVEPFQRCLSPKPGFLAGLRETCDRNGITLIFDEVVTGFRLAYGGAIERYGVVPDLVAYGKALGGGLPIGAFGGKRPIMDLVDEQGIDHNERYVWTASSLGGNPVSAAGANAALDIYRQPDTYEHLERIGQYFRDGLARTAHDAGLPCRILGEGPIGQIVFTSEPVTDYRSMRRANRTLARSVMLHLFENDVFLNPMGTKLYLSLAHDEDICDEFCSRLAAALRRATR